MYARHFARRARLLLALLLLASALLAACDSNPTPTPLPPSSEPTATTQVAQVAPTATPPQDISGTATPVAIATSEQPTEPIATPTPEAPAAPSSFSKITEAEQAGKIDHDTALLYQLYAYFDRESLPVEYQGDDSQIIAEAGEILAELATRLDKITPELRSKVEPFLLRPDDGGSFWNRQPDTQTSGGLNAKPPAAKPSPTIPAGWLYTDSANTNTRVWYPKPESGDGFAPMAAQLAQEIDTSRMWAIEKQAMLNKYEPCSDSKFVPNGGDGRLDIYLVAHGTGAPRGTGAGGQVLTPPWSGVFSAPPQFPGPDCAVAGYILINQALDFKHLKNVMAHELFHAFQSAITSSYGNLAWVWWQESTATWAMDLVYPQDNIEQEFVAGNSNSWSYQRRFSGPLTCTNQLPQCNYTAYLWPFYLTRGGGGATNDFIGRVTEQSRDRQPIAVMAEMNGWADQWKQFALWNWNEGPADFYRDPDLNGGEGHIAPLKQMAIDMAGKGRFEAPPPPWTTRGWGWPLDMAKTYSQDVNLPPASFDYYVAGKPPSNAGILRFEFGDLNKPDMGAVQAIVTIGDPDKPTARFVEDWSNKTERKFCLDRPDEYATNVVVIVSNSNLRPGDRLEGKLKVTAEAGTCPNNSNLNFSVGGSYSVHYNSAENYTSVSGSISTHEQVQSTWNLKFAGRERDDIKYTFLSTNQIDMNASANLSGQQAVPDLAPSFASMNASLSGSSTTHNPTQQGDDGYGQKTRATLGNQYNNLPNPDEPGSLTLTKVNGKDAYIMLLGITPMSPNYTSRSYLQSGCQPGSSYTHITDYDNKTFTTTHTESGDSYCYRYKDNPTEVELGPWVYGAVQLAHNVPRGPYGSLSFIGGYYDPKSNVIEGSETFSTKACADATKLDPLTNFVGAATNGLQLTYNGFEDPKASTCNLYYTIHWRVELPKQ